MSLSNIFMKNDNNIGLYLDREISMTTFKSNLHKVDRKYKISK